MFFLNHEINYVFLDFRSIKDKSACLAGLTCSKKNFSKLIIIDSDGPQKVKNLLSSDFPELLAQTNFSKMEDQFGWFVFPIREMLDEFHISPLVSVFISESSSNVGHAHSTTMGTILFNSGDLPVKKAKAGSDFIINSWDHLPEVFGGSILGIWGEAYLNLLQKGFLVRSQSGSKAMILKTENEKLPIVPIYYGGRYLSSDDESSKRHLYTQYILKSKSYPTLCGPIFTPVLKQLIEQIVSTEKIDSTPIVTYVPKRPSDAFDRLGLFFADFSKKVLGVDITLDCIRDYQKQKNAGSYANRTTNVNGAFKAKYTFANRDIVLMDDIGTSFATVNECALTLLRAGARKVIILCLGELLQISRW